MIFFSIKTDTVVERCYEFSILKNTIGFPFTTPRSGELNRVFSVIIDSILKLVATIGLTEIANANRSNGSDKRVAVFEVCDPQYFLDRVKLA